MRENEKALNHIKNLIEDLNRDLCLEIARDQFTYSDFTYILRVSIGNETYKLEFERSIIDDLEVALDKYKGTKYFDSLESSIKFTIYIGLGREGLLKRFNVSRALVNDKRDWIKDYKVDTFFPPEMTILLYEGLKKLLIFFNFQIERHKSLSLDYSEIEENKDWVQKLINYYEKNKHLDSAGSGTKNLQFLKAAAIKQIIDLEEKRDSEKMPTTLKAFDKKIYDIVTELRRDPFLEVELPQFIHDIARP